MLGHSQNEFLDEVTRIIGLHPPKPRPISTETTITYRLITEFLTHSIGRRESWHWECRNGFEDTSGHGGGVREHLFSKFSYVPFPETPARKQGVFGQPAYHYWFLVKDNTPMICLGNDGIAYTRDGDRHPLQPDYKKYRAIWPLIARIAMDLLP